MLYFLLDNNKLLSNLYLVIETDLSLYLIIFCSALIAGFIDSIAGGGGLIVTPVLLLLGLPPLNVLATNKLQAIFGTSTASLNYRRKLPKNNSKLISLFIVSFLSSIAGTIFITKIDSDLLLKAIPFLLIVLAIFFALKKDLESLDRKELMSANLYIFIVLLVGFYDGAIGPGTGTFFMIAFVSLKGMNLVTANYNTKVLNFASNLGSLIIFIYLDLVNITFGLIMGAGQVLGAYLGSNLALLKGSKIIKPTLVSVSLLMSIRILIT